MDQLKITKKNETFLFIETDPGIEMELTEHFCFFVPGYKFMPAYRNKFGMVKYAYLIHVKKLYTLVYISTLNNLQQSADTKS